jgi:hypothetical protein
VVAETTSPLKLRDPFDGRKGRWNRRDVKKVGNEYRCRLRAGESLEGGRG